MNINVLYQILTTGHMRLPYWFIAITLFAFSYCLWFYLLYGCRKENIADYMHPLMPNYKRQKLKYLL